MDVDDAVKDEHEDITELPQIAVPNDGKLRYKSWRKKYRKMRLVFEDRMEEASRLFISEHKARNIARRMREEIDQILELIVDINEDPRMPANVRWDVGQYSGSDESALPCGKSLEDLERRVTHTSSQLPDKSSLPPDLVDMDDLLDPPPGYLTLEHEEEYLNSIDASLAQIPSTDNLPANIEAVQPSLGSRPKPLPTEKDFVAQSPISVYNWLKRNQPHVFDQPKERADSERGDEPKLRGGAAAKAKKEKADKHISKQDLQFENLDEEIGFDPASDAPLPGSGRKGRRRDDHAYRPKGGASKVVKRKREKEDGVEAKGGKKAKTSTYLVMEED